MAEVIDIDVRLTLDKSAVDDEVKTSTDSTPAVSTDDPKSDEEKSDFPDKKQPKLKIGGEDLESDKGLQKLLGTTKSGLGNIRGFASNPLQFVGGMMPNVMNMIPVIAVITAILSLPEVIKKLVKTLTARGQLFDRFLKIKSEEAQNAFFTRLEQRDRQLGKRQIIYSGNKGFRNENGALTGNSFKNLGTGRTAGSDIGTTRTASILDKAGGL